MITLANIPFKLNIETFLKRLHIESESDDAKELSKLLDKVRQVGKPKAIYKEAFIQEKGDETVTIDGIVFTSHVLRKNLDDVERVFPFVVTCGNEVDKINIPQDDFLKAFWLDTIKASLLNSATHHLCTVLDQKYRLEKTASMSPGSGDTHVWPIEQQKELFSLFGNVEKHIGVRLTDSFLMQPNKSVSGIRFPTEIDFQTCQLCHRKNCEGRKAPFDKELWEEMQHH